MTEYLKFQALMDKAYEGFTDRMSLVDFYKSLDSKTVQVVAFGNLNYQVENGGFLQWHDNGYGVGYTDILQGLARLGTSEAVTMTKLLQQARSLLLTLDKRNDPEDDDDFEPVGLDAMDTAFYALAPAILQQIEDSLS